MRIIGFVLVLFILFPSISHAAYTYVKVTKTKSKSKLTSIKKNLGIIGQTSTYRVTKTGYVIYAGPYKNISTARYALKKIKRYFKYASLVKTKTRLNSKKSTKSSLSNSSHKKEGFFVGGSLGYFTSSLSYSGNVDIYSPNDKGISYDINGGYTFNNSTFVTLGYLRADASDVVFDNVYLSANYKFEYYGDYVPYFGILGGYSKLTWNRNPLNNSTASASNSSDSFFAGTEVGLLYTGLETITLYTNYECLFMNHTTVVTVGEESSSLEHRTLHNLQFGIRYSF